MGKASQVGNKGPAAGWGGPSVGTAAPVMRGPQGGVWDPLPCRPALHLWPRAEQPMEQGRPETQGPKPVLHGAPVLRLNRQ